jgi:hypothetical protein
MFKLFQARTVISEKHLKRPAVAAVSRQQQDASVYDGGNDCKRGDECGGTKRLQTHKRTTKENQAYYVQLILRPEK